MKRVIYLLALVVLTGVVSACDDNAVTAPSDGSSSSTFTAVLLPASEVPPITGDEAGGSGTATLTFNLSRDAAGNATAATLDVTANVTGFPPGTALTASHIHPGATGANGGVFVSLGLSPGEVTFATGSGSFSKRGITLTVDQANTILANFGAFYLNIHTAANPNGVARGQLTRQ
jgi:CHRD domain-containing protein